ncbi:hypothetical protein VNO77_42910 [Canavalia gladiata]|uniref:GBF-interacting protein 1 N-terminal domain-containing protein n=1 Tax=Canavalia gladiata TaxID=3824 RepID=A0AAN9PPH0_CANGL
MGSESKNRNGDGCGGDRERVGVAQEVPATVKKVVQSVKEIVNCTEQEIYVVLKECDMDPNRAVERLLAQDTFREVRSKRERRKEMKEAFDSRTKGNNAGFSRGSKTGAGSDRSVVQSGLTHVTNNEHVKAIDEGEDGSLCPAVTSSATPAVGKSTKLDYFSTDNRRQSLGTGYSVSDSAQASPAPQPSMVGMNKGRLSMADIVRMGRTSQDAVSHNHCNALGTSTCGNSESSVGLPYQSHSEQQTFHDDRSVIEQPVARNSQELNISASSNASGPFEPPSFHDTAVCLRRNCELGSAQVSWGDVACDNVISEKIESASISSKQTILSSHTGLRSDSNSNLRNTLYSDLCSSYEPHEDVSSAASIFQRLNIGESTQKVLTFGDDPTVVIPNHLQALGADCSHLSFGTYNGGSSSASSAILISNHLSKSGLEEKCVAVDDSSARCLDASSVYHDDKQFGFDFLRGTAGGNNPDFLSSPKQGFVKHIVPEETPENECDRYTASATDPSLQRSHWVNPSPTLKQPGLQNENDSSFPRERYADSNSLPGDVLAFLMSQSQPARHSNAVSSIGNPAISMSEVMEPGTFVLRKRSALHQDPTVQSSAHFRQLPGSKGYLSLPQNQSYITTINSQQAFSGNTAYNQSSADMKYNLPQNRNEFLTSRLPPATARDAFSYGNLGSSFYSPGSFLSNPTAGYRMPPSKFDEILPSRYNGGHNISSIQQHGSLSHWDYGAESRSSIIPERNQYNFAGQPNQASLSQYASAGYSDLHSQARVLEELKQTGGFQDLSSKQLHQFWQHSR